MEADAEGGKTGTLILDATCAPQKITFPQDISILKAERFYYYKPRMYRNNARKDYLNLAKCKKRNAKKICAEIKKQRQYIRRDWKYLKALLGKAAAPVEFGAKLNLWVIIRSGCWQIRFVGTGRIWDSAKIMESGFQVHR